MGKFDTVRPDLPEVDDDVQPCFEDEGKWTDKQKATFSKLNQMMETPSELARTCACYMLVIMNHRTEQMLMLRASKAFKDAMNDAGFTHEEIHSVTRYAEALPAHGGGGVNTGRNA